MSYKGKHKEATWRAQETEAGAKDLSELVIGYTQAFRLQCDAIDMFTEKRNKGGCSDDYITMPIFCIKAAEYALKARLYADARKYAELGQSQKWCEKVLHDKLEVLRLEAMMEIGLYGIKD